MPTKSKSFKLDVVENDVNATSAELESLAIELEKGRQDYLAGRTLSHDEVRNFFEQKEAEVMHD